MSPEKPPKEEFIDMVVEINRHKGLDDLTSKLVGILFIEPKEISLDELSGRTGYSLSGVSTAMKLLVNSGLVKRFKKPGSRKIYFYMQKGMFDSFIDVMKKSYAFAIQSVKKRAPEIIRKYKQDKSKEAREELRIVEDYYNQVLRLDGVLKKFIGMLEESQKEVRK